MQIARVIVVGLLGLSGSGCLIGFDADRLTSGKDAAPAGTTDAPADMASTTAPNGASCDDFSAYMPGTALPNWVDGRGTWRVIMNAQGKVLAQTTDGTSRNDRFVAWLGGKDYTDSSISAVATLSDMTDMNCVLVRLQDAMNYYALCVADVGGRNRPSSHEWRLNLMSAGVETRLASAALTTTGAHTLALRAQGSTLTASVDGAAKPALTDPTFTHGAIGVSTDDYGGFTSLCTVGQ